MEQFIDNIYIRNFKSIIDCEILNCKRINLFIGRPNVGKSNIIEALSMFSIPYLKEGTSKKISELVRIENETELFYNGNWERESYVSLGFATCNIQFHPKEALSIFLHQDNQTYGAKINERLKVTALSTAEKFETNIKRYSFKSNLVYKKGHAKYLIPPFGYNLLTIIEHYKKLKEEVIAFFSEYGLQIVFDKSSQTLKVLEKNKNEIFLIPYNSVADTLQRIIFYKAAIESNNNSVLLFEEPEAHAFPPYMSHLTQEMIYKKDNQFFIATHSPFILNDLLENAQDDLAVFNVDYQDKQTIVKPLSSLDLYEVFQNGIDLFTNNEMYL